MQPIVNFGETAQLDHLAREVVTSGAAPMAACAVRYRTADHWLGSSGFAERIPSVEPSADRWLFDLASVTKPLFATAVHTAIADGMLTPETNLAQLLPCIHGTRAENATVESLLSHRSGLVPHVELYGVMQGHNSKTLRELLRVVANNKLPEAELTNVPPPPVYSDLGYILLGAAIETHFNTKLDDWCAYVARHWWPKDVGSVRQLLASSGVPPRHFVPTEVVPWRGGQLSGVVHDENAWLISGHGMSGHAGLFATADAVADFGVACLDAVAGRDSPIPRDAALHATARRPGGTLCAGFDRRTGTGSTAGSFCSDETFGHLGFTGTSIWCDPIRAIVVVLLTNRVCPSRENLRLRALRPLLHDALFRWADSRRN